MFSGLRSFGYWGAALEREESSEKRVSYQMATESFENTVLKWSLEDIMNENLFKVEHIPERFESESEYLDSFKSPLVEETRAELHSNLESISEAPYVAVEFPEKIQPSKGAVVVYTMHTDREYDMGEEKDKQNLKLKPKDILILSTRIPQCVEDLHDYMLVVVSRTECQYKDTYGGNEDSSILEVKAYVRDMHPFSSQNSSMENRCFGIYLGNLTRDLRIWKALHTDLANETTNLAVLAKAVYYNTEDCNEAFVEENEDDYDIEILRNKHFKSHKLNVSQTSAIVSAVNAVKKKEHPSIKLIHGPPGTGKTSMLVSLLSVLLHRRYKVLVCAPTNAAISEIATRFLNLVRSPSDQCPNTDDFPCVVTSSDLVLVGNEERLDVKGPLGIIFLEDRVDRLKNCCLPMKGWRKIVTDLHDFHEFAISQYGDSQETAQEDDSVNFLQFVRERLEILGSKFFDCAKILLNDYPGSISEKRDLEHLTEVVERFVNLIQKNAFKDKTLRECFSGHGEISKEASKYTENFKESVINNKKLLKETLFFRRSECMHFLEKELCCERISPSQDILKICLSRAKVVFSTVSSSGKSYMKLAAPFDCLIIDEAAQLKEAESTIALQITGVRHAFLTGDPKQLPATVISKLAEKANYGRSLFERLESLGHPVHTLNIQYRMHPLISLFPNREFYESHIKNGPNVEMQPYGYNYLTSEMYGANAFISVTDGREEKDDFGKSKRNIIEAVVVMYILSKLYKVCSCRGNSISVGVVSPYREQVLYLESKLTTKDEWKKILDIEVQTVDGFQGGEKDIIIISTVRTKENIGFLGDRRRTNVALTRARFCLWIIGHGPCLAESNSVWAKIVMDAISRKHFLYPSMDPEMVKVIRKAKAESDQLKDLLNKDSVLFNNTVWKVLFSEEFKESFTKIKFLQVRQRVINTILNIANGWRQTRRESSHSDEVLVNEYRISGLYLVWTTDVQRGREIMQVLKIWNVLRLENLPRFRKRLENIFQTYTPMYIERCKEKRLNRERNRTLPCIWEDDRDFVWYRSLKQSEMPETSQCNPSEREELTLEHARVEESLLLMKFYSLSSGISNQLLTARDGSEIGLQFEVNDEESQIVRFPRSLFILGRSGTGKTTVLTMRLLQKEQQSKAALHGLFWDQPSEFQGMERKNERSCIRQKVEDGRNIRQMFLTVSAKLCSAVRNNLARIDSSLLGKHHTPYMAMHDSSDRLGEMKDIPDSFIDIPEKNFPLVITFYKFLMMLDGSVPCHFFDGEKGSIHGKSIAFMEIMRTREVDYERFNSMYWPHFSEDLKRGLDSSAVFTEIVSHIKGSLISMNSSNFMMSGEDYVLMAESRVSILNAKQREAIYELFLHYEKQKQRNGDFDIADLVNHLHCQLRSNAYLGQKMDFIYVDEVQDLTMAQITLFKYVCSNFHEGYVFAGDTAQTIARGVNFRFQDIRNVFYKEFLEADVNNGVSSQIGMPDLFHLSQNFRTHSGIIKLAQSVVELLYHFFPLAVDRLRPESSLIFGEAPIFLITEEDESLITKIFGHGGNFGSGKNEFGAEQAILVRDDHAKVQVLSQVGKQGLVLTILECKGLEFQDVLLYNFFTSSPLATKWRVIYQFMDQKAFNSFDQKAQPKFPTFDNGKHNLLCSELKHLYVAITRVKQRLWIYEENRDFAKSILDYWKEMGLIQLRCLDSSLVESMYVASSFEDWKKRGIQMFNEQNYDMAIICFERARDSHMTKWAKAASLRHSGQRLLALNPESAKSLLSEAAEIFLSIGKSDSAANCYIVLGDYKKAGIIYEEKCGEAMLEAAGDCFAEAKCWHRAASAYARAKANCVSKCLDACLKGKSFMIGLEFIEVWKKHNCNTNCGKCHGCESVKVETDYLKKCATHYHQKKDTKSMMKFVNAFPSLDEIRSFLLRRDYFQELLGVEEAAGNFEKAADMAALKGDLLLEADMREKAGQYGLAIRSILLHVQLNSFWRTGNKGWPLQEFPEKDKLLKKVKDIAEKDQSHAYESLQCEASILSDELYSLPELTEHMIHAKKMGNIRLEIFSLRKVLDAHLNLDIKLFQLAQGMSSFMVGDSSKMLLENKISPTTLFFLWDEWKDKLLSSVNALSRYEKRRETEQDICYLEYALEYFGVRKNKSDRFCNAINSEAFWLKGIDFEFLQRQWNTMQISIQTFFMSAKKFFTMDLYSVGRNVIEKLEKLYSLCMRQNCNIPIQGALLVQMYQVSEPLKNIEHLTGQCGLQQVPKLAGVVKGCKERFFDVFFPLKHQDENIQQFISLREDAASILILQDITSDIVRNMERSITLGQIGKLQVLLPFLPKDLGTEYGKKIIECLNDKHYWSDQLLWLDMDTSPEISLLDRRLYLVKSFGQALSSTFKNWEKIDYISPHIFLILLEKLFFLASSCEQLLTGLFLPRSFFIEFMSGKQGEFSSTWLLQSQSQLRFEGSCEKIYDLLSNIIRHLLLSDKYGTVKWIEASNIKYFPEFILHLIIMLCLICINCAGNLPNYTQLLRQIFRDSEITKNLPLKFREGLLQLLGKSSSNRKIFLINLSKAMRGIKNPLVMINLSKSHESIDDHNDIIILTEENLVCKESVLRAVFQENDVNTGNERNEDIKNHDLLKHIEKDLSSNSKHSISNTGHILESGAAKETHDYITDNAELLIHYREKEGVCLTDMSNTETEEQQKVDFVRTEMTSTSENISFPLFEDDEPSHKWKVNGQHVPWFVVWRMKKWLHFAREKLDEHIPLKEKYAEEALKVFQGKENQPYTENFVSKACPLKAEVDEYMDLIITTIPKVKQGHISYLNFLIQGIRSTKIVTLNGLQMMP